MVAAHLRGLLSKNHSYGLRSSFSEDVILEAVAAELIAHNIESSTHADLALLPVLNEKGITVTMDKASARGGRAAELRLLDIYRVAEQVGRKVKSANPHKEISLHQLYQLAEKKGIFEAFDEHYLEENSKPLL
tara:strand:- start:6199 stop:6597 length:399 start_codon:yes stop_codon:yes gene_type:complete